MTCVHSRGRNEAVKATNVFVGILMILKIHVIALNGILSGVVRSEERKKKNAQSRTFKATLKALKQKKREIKATQD